MDAQSKLAEVSRRFAFRATHQSPGGPSHEDAFELMLTVRGPVGEDGKVVDFDKLAAAAGTVLVRLHGADVTAALGLRTVEEIAGWIFGEVSIWVPQLHEVELRDGACSVRHWGEDAA